MNPTDSPLKPWIKSCNVTADTYNEDTSGYMDKMYDATWDPQKKWTQENAEKLLQNFAVVCRTLQ